VVDLAAMRDAITRLGGDPEKINPLVSWQLPLILLGRLSSYVLVMSTSSHNSYANYGRGFWGLCDMEEMRIFIRSTVYQQLIYALLMKLLVLSNRSQ
jgi:hypothetical protein